MFVMMIMLMMLSFVYWVVFAVCSAFVVYVEERKWPEFLLR